MPTYAFESKDGEQVERFYPMSEAPKRIRIGGKYYRRIISVPTIAAAKMRRASLYPFVSDALPRKLPGFKHEPRTGKPVIHSQREAKEAAQKTGLGWDK